MGAVRRARPALVDRELFERVNDRIQNTRGPGRRRPRAVEGKYVLAGLLRCAACGRSMHGATLKNKPYYRCNAQRPDYADTEHPKTTAVREERILDAVDDWLNQLADSRHRNATIASVLTADAAGSPEPPEVRTARRALATLPVELDRVLAAIRAGMDANLAAATTKQIQLDLASAESTVIVWEQQHRTVRSLSASDVAAALDHAGDLANILKDAEREARARLYRTLGLQLLLDPVGNRVEARLQLSGGGGGI